MTTIQTHRITLAQKEDVAENTCAFHFTKPSAFSFVAGQYVTLTILAPTYTDAKGVTRSLSIASAPQEDVLTFVMRGSDSAFKKSLWALPIGGSVEIKGPLGKFVLPEDASRPVVFLAAGVGITPVRSMVRHAVHENSARPMWLFYANRNPEAAAYEDELAAITLPNWQCVNTMTDGPLICAGWDGEQGNICPDLLIKYLAGVHAPLYYVVGPGGFVKAMQQMLAQMNIPKEQTVVDNFGGV